MDETPQSEPLAAGAEAGKPLKLVYDARGEYLLRRDHGEPECGVDFCDRCGDCLACYGGDFCYESASGDHVWVAYERSEA